MDSSAYVPRYTEEILLCRACFSNVGLKKMSDSILLIYCQVTNTALKPDESHGFPKCLCSVCLLLLRKLHNFRQLCQQSYIQMHKMALWGKLDTKSLLKLSDTKSMVNLSFKTASQVIDYTIPSELSSLKHTEGNPPKSRKRIQPYNSQTEAEFLRCRRLINSIQPHQPVNNSHHDDTAAKVAVVAGCAKGKRTLALETRTDNNTTPNVHNERVKTYAATALLNNPFKQDPRKTVSIVINNGVIERQPVIGTTSNNNTTNPPYATTAVIQVHNRETPNPMMLNPVLNNVIQMHYNAALAVLDCSQSARNHNSLDTTPTVLSEGICSPLNEAAAQNFILNQHMPAVNCGFNQNTPTATAVLNMNTFAQNLNTGIHAQISTDSGKTNEVAAIKNEWDEVEDQGVCDNCDNDETNMNIDEIATIKAEFDDIVKEEHLIHPVEDEETSQFYDFNQKHDAKNLQTEPSPLNIDANKQSDDNIVEIDDSSSSSSDSSSSSSTSSSSSSSSDSNDDVVEVDLTAVDDEVIILDTNDTDKISDPSKISENKIENSSKEKDSKNAQATMTDEIYHKRELCENINIDGSKESSVEVNISKKTSTENIVFDGKTITLYPGSSLENHKNHTNVANTKEIVKDTPKKFEDMMKTIDETNKNVETTATLVEYAGNNVKNPAKIIETMSKNIEKTVFDGKTITLCPGSSLENHKNHTNVVDTKEIVKDTPEKNEDTMKAIEETNRNVETTATLVEYAGNNVKNSAKIIETTSKNVEKTNNVEETSKIIQTINIVDTTAKNFEEQKTLQPRIHSSYHDDDSSSGNSDDLPDCLIGFNSDVYRKDTKLNFTGREHGGVQVKKQKIRFVDEKEEKQKNNKKRRIDSTESSSSSDETMKNHQSSVYKRLRIQRRNINKPYIHAKRDRKWRKERDKLREKVSHILKAYTKRKPV